MERLTKRDTDGQAMMDCEKCKADWTGKHGKPMVDCTANAALTKQIDRMNDEAINKANEIANLKADADVLRNKLADTEEALGRANAELGAADGALVEMNDKIVRCEAYSKTLRGDVNNLQLEVIDAGIRANYAESHPWRNLWAWVKRKLGGE